MAKIIAVNAGSSSLKFQLIDMTTQDAICEGIIDRIGFTDSGFQLKHNGEKIKSTESFPTHKEAVDFLLNALTANGVVSTLDEIDACGHRLVHGGSKFTDSVVINEEVIEVFKECSKLAPLHNPANLTGYEAFKAALPGAGHVGVFDTAFHQTMDKTAYAYPVPKEWMEKHGIRKYGFHGTSHKFVAGAIQEEMGRTDLRHINCHLGNGASLAAIKNGKCIDTSMGFTPLAGIMMGTRSGDIDPAIVAFVAAEEGITADEVTNILNKKSGMLGVSGISSDSRDIEDGIKAGNEDAIFTDALYIKRICDYIGQYAVALGGVDVITFTAGLGENAVDLRANIAAKLEGALGAKICSERNNVRGKTALISKDDSKVALYVVPTNEELVIAQDTQRLLGL